MVTLIKIHEFSPNHSRLFLKHVYLTAKYGRNVVVVNQKVGSPILGRIYGVKAARAVSEYGTSVGRDGGEVHAGLQADSVGELLVTTSSSPFRNVDWAVLGSTRR